MGPEVGEGRGREEEWGICVILFGPLWNHM